MSSGGERTELPIDPDMLAGDEHPPGAGRRGRGSRADMVVVASIGCGGVIGALARYGLSVALPTVARQFPWATFIVNVSGGALLGFLLVLLTRASPRRRLLRPVLGTGVLGAYTTFSTLAVEAVLLVRAGRLPTAVVYFFGSVVAGLGAVWLGMAAGRLALRTESADDHPARMR